jgi:hypothetical protein
MKVKLGTSLDRDLVRRARSLAACEGKRLNQVIEEALWEHLGRKPRQKATWTERTAGMIKLPRREVQRILREEPGIFDL